MNYKNFRFFIQCFVFLFVFIHLGQKYKIQAAENKKVYLSQVFVDTMVQNAYYNFVATSELSGGEFRQTQAIAHARNVASKLKNMAKGDPNRRYIMWRVGELEEQIFLEEEEIQLKRKYKTQKAINVLVSEFNPEIGKKRPSFASLYAIHERMINLSWRKADELKWLITDRNRNISREAQYFCEKAMNASNYDKALKEFDYIRKNRKYLVISAKKYRELEYRLQAKNEADDMMKNLDKYTREIQRIISGTDIQEAKFTIDFLKYRLKQIKPLINHKKYSTFIQKINDLSEIVIIKEDSLVDVNMQLVSAGRPDAAIDYLDNVLRKYCVSNKKLIKVDKAIMLMPGQSKSMVDKNIDRELNTFESSLYNSNGLDFNDVEQKAAEKADSIRAEKYGRDRKPYRDNRRDSEDGFETSYENNTNNLSINQKKAQEVTAKIYNLLDQNKPAAAYAKYKQNLNPLKKHSPNKVFFNLKNAVLVANESTSRNNSWQTQEQATLDVQKIYELIDQNKIIAAQKYFEKKQIFIKKFVSNDVFSALRSFVLSEVNANH